MATFETSFYQQAKPFEIESPVKQYATLAQLRALQDQAATSNLTRRKTEQEFERQNQLRDLYRQAGSDQQLLRTRLAEQGFIPELQAIDKARLEAEAKAASTAKDAAETQKLKAAQFRDLAAQATPDEQGYERFKQQGVAMFGPNFAAQFPAYTPDWQSRAIATADQKFKANQPIMKEVNDGQRTVFVDVNPVSNPAVRELSIQMQMTPAQLAQDARALQQLAEQMRHNRTTEGISGGHLALARQREAREASAPHGQYDSERGIIVDPREGTARPVTMEGAPLAPKMPEFQKKELAGIDSQLNIVDKAIKDTKATPSAFSMRRGLATLGGTISESVAGRMDSEQERQTRAYVYNVVSKVINERAGAAQSAQELARLRSFLPAETDQAKQVEDKLLGFQNYLLEQRKGYQGPPSATPPSVTANRPSMSNFGQQRPGARPPLETFQR